MLGINYESSDDEEPSPGLLVELPNLPTNHQSIPPEPTPNVSQSSSAISPSITGPAQGPPVISSVVTSPTDDTAPGSPYSESRAIIQSLTLPTVPNWDIPPSPPGSPPQRATKKFAQFLELKKKGQHFNQRLEGSPVMRDPSHLQKLMGYAQITEEEQYASVLPEELGVPAVFPPWAHWDELNAVQSNLNRAKQGERTRNLGRTVDFVPAKSSGASQRTLAQMAGKKRELERRGGKDDSDASQKHQLNSRSPRRRSISRER